MRFLSPTITIDSDHPAVVSFMQKTAGNEKNKRAVAVKLFNAVRDGIVYDLYAHIFYRFHYSASNTLRRKKGYCVSKACLLCALGRAAGIPSRLGLADIQNHGAVSDVVDMMGSNIFVYHGFVEFFLQGKWIKATPAFDASVCDKHNIALVTFDGYQDAVFPSHDLEGNLYVEYLKYHGSYADLPLEEIIPAYQKVYGDERVDLWLQLQKEDLKTRVDNIPGMDDISEP